MRGLVVLLGPVLAALLPAVAGSFASALPAAPPTTLAPGLGNDAPLVPCKDDPLSKCGKDGFARTHVSPIVQATVEETAAAAAQKATAGMPASMRSALVKAAAAAALLHAEEEAEGVAHAAAARSLAVQVAAAKRARAINAAAAAAKKKEEEAKAAVTLDAERGDKAHASLLFPSVRREKQGKAIAAAEKRQMSSKGALSRKRRGHFPRNVADMLQQEKRVTTTKATAAAKAKATAEAKAAAKAMAKAEAGADAEANTSVHRKAKADAYVERQGKPTATRAQIAACQRKKQSGPTCWFLVSPQGLGAVPFYANARSGRMQYTKPGGAGVRILPVGDTMPPTPRPTPAREELQASAPFMQPQRKRVRCAADPLSPCGADGFIKKSAGAKAVPVPVPAATTTAQPKPAPPRTYTAVERQAIKALFVTTAAPASPWQVSSTVVQPLLPTPTPSTSTRAPSPAWVYPFQPALAPQEAAKLAAKQAVEAAKKRDAVNMANHQTAKAALKALKAEASTAPKVATAASGSGRIASASELRACRGWGSRCWYHVTPDTGSGREPYFANSLSGAMVSVGRWNSKAFAARMMQNGQPVVVNVGATEPPTPAPSPAQPTPAPSKYPSPSPTPPPSTVLAATSQPMSTDDFVKNAPKSSFILSDGGSAVSESGLQIVRPTLPPTPTTIPPAALAAAAAALRSKGDATPATMRPHIIDSGRARPRSTTSSSAAVAASSPSSASPSFVGCGASRLCGATSPSPTRWQRYGTRGGLYAVIDISYCKFSTATRNKEGGIAPRVSVALLGSGGRRWGLTGMNGVAKAGVATFTVYLVPLQYGYARGSSSAELLRQAALQRWRVSWLAATGDHSGITRQARSRRTPDLHGARGPSNIIGGTRWNSWLAAQAAATGVSSTELAAARQQPSSVLFVDVDTRRPRGSDHTNLVSFERVPMYFPTLVDDSAEARWAAGQRSELREQLAALKVKGNEGWNRVTTRSAQASLGRVRVCGQHVVYHATERGFRLYVVPATPLSPEQARERWRVSWLAAFDGDAIGRGGLTLRRGSKELAAAAHAIDAKDSGVLGRAAVSCAACAKQSSNAGDGGAKWALSSDKTSVVRDIDASGQHFNAVPSYISAVQASMGGSDGSFAARFRSPRWFVTGAAAVANPTPTGFRVYLRPHGAGKSASQSAEASARTQAPLLLDMVQLFDWRVSYIGFAGPVACIVSPWSAFGPCSVPCAGGVRHRNRTVVQDPSNGGAPCPALESFTLCNTGKCVIRPVDCAVSSWSSWNATARWVTAGTAAMAVANVASAMAVEEAAEEAAASGVAPSVATIASQKKAAALLGGAVVRSGSFAGSGALVPLIFMDAGGNACSADCGGGTQFRNRTVVKPAAQGGRDCPTLSQVRACNSAACAPRNCTVSAWSNVSLARCSRSCGRGHRVQHRTVLLPPRHGGKGCPPLELSSACNMWSCPQDCVVSHWAAWEPPCSGYGYGSDARCAPRQQVRRRVVLRADGYGGRICPHHMQTRECGVALSRPCVGAADKWKWRTVGAGGQTYGPFHNETAAAAIAAARASAIADAAGMLETADGLAVKEAGDHAAAIEASAIASKQNHAGQQGAPAEGRLCGDATLPSAEWNSLSADPSGRAIVLSISTAGCAFEAAPQYAISLLRLQRDPMWQQLAGSATVLSPRADGFQVALFHPSMRAAELLRAAVAFDWGVSWVGDFGRRTGVTISGASGWQQDPASLNTLFIDVDAAGCGFRDPLTMKAAAGLTPKWFPSLRSDDDADAVADGDGGEGGEGGEGAAAAIFAWRASGAAVVFRPSLQGFRVYVRYFMPISPEDAERAGWAVGWVASVDEVNAGERFTSWTASAGADALLLSGLQASGGMTKAKGSIGDAVGGLRANVDTSASRFEAAPVGLVASLLPHEGVTIGAVSGALTLGAVTASGFEVYLGRAKVAGFGATVAYVGFARVDCAMSDWGSWSSCDAQCGGGRQVRERRVLRKARGGGKPCTEGGGGGGGGGVGSGEFGGDKAFGGAGKPAQLREHRPCHTKGCIGDGATHYCGDVSAAQWYGNATMWKALGTNSLWATVDTAWCGYKYAPSYVVNVVGSTGAWQLTGTHTVVSPTARHFRVQLYHRGLRGAALLKAASTRSWRVSWVSDSGHQAGRTVSGATRWRPLAEAAAGSLHGGAIDVPDPAPGIAWVLFTDVDTSGCHYASDDVRYIVSQTGDTGAWLTHGAHLVHEPTRRGFRTYLVSLKRITAAEAQRRGWAISWVGTTSEQGATAGRQTAGWKYGSTAPVGGLGYLGSEGETLYGGHARAFWHVHVDTARAAFQSVPAYVTSVQAAGGLSALGFMWLAMGAANVYSPTASGFDVYLEGAPNLHFPGQSRWGVNYLGFERRDCSATPWGSWGACPCKGIKLTLAQLGAEAADGAIERQQTRTRSALAGGGVAAAAAAAVGLAGSTCTPVSLSESKPCECGTVPPTPPPTPPATLAPTPAPTPLAAAVTATLRIAGLSLRDVTPRARLRAALGAALGLTLNAGAAGLRRLALPSVSEDAALEHSVAARMTGKVIHGIVIKKLRVWAPTAAAAEDVAGTLADPTFPGILRAKLDEQRYGGLGAGAVVLVGKPAVTVVKDAPTAAPTPASPTRTPRTMAAAAAAAAQGAQRAASAPGAISGAEATVANALRMDSATSLLHSFGLAMGAGAALSLAALLLLAGGRKVRALLFDFAGSSRGYRGSRETERLRCTERDAPSINLTPSRTSTYRVDWTDAAAQPGGARRQSSGGGGRASGAVALQMRAMQVRERARERATAASTHAAKLELDDDGAALV